MFVINNAITGILEIDQGINRYCSYLANINVLPEGTYCLAGGAMRSLLDGTRVKDLDIYIIGSESDHLRILGDIAGDSLEVQKFSNPFAQFKVFNITPEIAKYFDRSKTAPITKSIDDDPFFCPPETATPESEWAVPIQLISHSYDSRYYTDRIPRDVPSSKRFADAYVSSTKQVISSFDLTISKAAFEFTITNNTIAVSTVVIPTDCLIDICMRKLRLAANDGVTPQQLCTLKRFHKFVKLGYDVDGNFHNEWKSRLQYNPHVLEIDYD